MSFNYLNKTIREDLLKGRSREDIFAERCEYTPPRQHKRLAFAIASIPEEEQRNEFAKTNLMLTIFLVLNGFLCALTVFPLLEQNSFIFSIVQVICPFSFCFFTLRFYGGVYKLIAIWTLLDLISSSLAVAIAPEPLGLAKVLVLLIVVVLSWHIARKVFPNLGLLGVKKNSDGSFKL